MLHRSHTDARIWALAWLKARQGTKGVSVVHPLRSSQEASAQSQDLGFKVWFKFRVQGFPIGKPMVSKQYKHKQKIPKKKHKNTRTKLRIPIRELFSWESLYVALSEWILSETWLKERRSGCAGFR